MLKTCHVPAITPHVRRILILALVYFLSGQVSFMISVSHSIVTIVVFTAEGFALAAVIRSGWRLWPGVLIGQLMLAVFNGVPLSLALGISAINSAEAVIGALLFQRWGLHQNLGRLKDASALLVLVFFVLQPFSATLGVGLLSLGGKIPEGATLYAWFSWWFGNSMGQILITPLLLAFWNAPPQSAQHRLRCQWITAAIMALSLFLFTQTAFKLLGLVFIPTLILVGVTRGMLSASISTFVMAVTALIATSLGGGPFVVNGHENLLHLNLFLFSTVLCVQLVSATFNERQQLLVDVNRYLETVNHHVITSSTDKKGVIQSVSQAFCNISGYSREELIGRAHNIVRHSDMPKALYKEMWTALFNGQCWHGEIKNRRKDGTAYWVDVHIEPNYGQDGEITGFTAIRQDITDKKHIEQLSITDSLTQLFNRMKIDDVLQKEDKRSDRYGRLLSVILFDVDHFKHVNDTYGHPIGDEVLIGIAKLLRETLREVDIPGRWGGEEFLVICPETDLQGAACVAEKLRAAFAAHIFPAVGQKTCSFGVAMRQEGERSDHLLSRVDEALYRAKQTGRNRVERAA